MSNITPLDALIALGEIEVVSNGIRTNAEEYKSMMYRVDGVPINATWEQVVAKMAEMPTAVSYTHLRAHETREDRVRRLEV